MHQFLVKIKNLIMMTCTLFHLLQWHYVTMASILRTTF